MNRRYRTVAAYLAALAMALQALWPLVAQAKPRSATLVPICAVDGVTHYLELPGGKSPLEQRSSAHHDHCAFCSFGAERAILPYGFQPVFVVQEFFFSHVPVRSFFVEEHNASCAQPRAPPAVS